MMSRRQAIEEALAAWRDAQHRLDAGPDGDRDALAAEVERHRGRFQRLSAEHMIDRLDALKEAESRRAGAMPSSDTFHEAARDEKQIASEIWEHARASDEDTP